MRFRNYKSALKVKFFIWAISNIVVPPGTDWVVIPYSNRREYELPP